MEISDSNNSGRSDNGKGHSVTANEPDEPTHYEPDEAINNPPIIGLYMGRRRPLFYHDAPRWLTNLVFAFFLAIILASILLR